MALQPFLLFSGDADLNPRPIGTLEKLALKEMQLKI